MSIDIEKELLLSRLKYLSDIKLKEEESDKNKLVLSKIKEMILEGKINTNMAVESVFNHLLEEENLDDQNIDKVALEIINFLE